MPLGVPVVAVCRAGPREEPYRSGVAPMTVPTLTWGQDLRHFPRVLENYAVAGVALHREFGDAVRVRFPVRALNLFHPRQVVHVLRAIHDYPKSEDYETLEPVLGQGIFVAEGEVWARQRKLLAPEFRASVIPRYLDVIVRDLEAMFTDRWEPTLGQPRDLAQDMMYLTIRVVGDSIFAQDFKDVADAIGHDLEVCLDQATFRMMTARALPTWMPTPGNIRSWRAEKDLDGIVDGLIQAARGTQGAHDMLTRLLAATVDGQPAMTHTHLRDEIKSLILAGHETTSLALSWSFYLLSRHPEAQAALQAEVDEVLGGRMPTAADLPRLVYTRMVLYEAMRLYPPVPVVTRRAVKADTIEGVEVAAGEKVVLFPFVTHRHPEVWKEPEAFDPGRFAPDKVDDIPEGAWLPFLVGRRACLGEHFALLEGIAALAGMVSRYRIERVEHEPIASRPISTLRLERPMMVRISRR